MSVQIKELARNARHSIADALGFVRPTNISPQNGGIDRTKFLLEGGAAGATLLTLWLTGCRPESVTDHPPRPDPLRNKLKGKENDIPVAVNTVVFALLPAPYQSIDFHIPGGQIKMSEGTVEPAFENWDTRYDTYYGQTFGPPERVLIYRVNELVAHLDANLRRINGEFNKRLGLPTSYVDYYDTTRWFSRNEEENPFNQVLGALEKDGYVSPQDGPYHPDVRYRQDLVYFTSERARPEVIDGVVFSAIFDAEHVIADGVYSTLIRYQPSNDLEKTALYMKFFERDADIGEMHVVYPYNLEDIVRSIKDEDDPSSSLSGPDENSLPLPVDQICNFRLPLSEMPPTMLDAANRVLAKSIEEFGKRFPGFKPEFVLNYSVYSVSTGTKRVSTRTITYSELTENNIVTEHNGTGLGINLGFIIPMFLEGDSESSGTSTTSGTIHDSGQTTDTTEVIHTGLGIQGHVILVPVATE